LQISCGFNWGSESQQTPADPVTKETPDASSENEIPPVSENWDGTIANEFLTISELKKKHPTEGIYETEGYVVDSVGECNCSPGARCKCDPASITISEEQQIPRSDTLNEKELRILVNPDAISGGEKYRFKIRAHDYSSDGEPLDEVFYVAHKPTESD